MSHWFQFPYPVPPKKERTPEEKRSAIKKAFERGHITLEEFNQRMSVKPMNVSVL